MKQSRIDNPSWWDKRLMWYVAMCILEDEGGCALPVGEPIVQRTKGGGKVWQEWAIDLRKCCPDFALPSVDTFYAKSSSEYTRIPRHLRPILRPLWREAIKRKKLQYMGMRIVSACYGENLSCDDEIAGLTNF